MRMLALLVPWRVACLGKGRRLVGRMRLGGEVYKMRRHPLCLYILRYLFHQTPIHYQSIT